MAGYHGRRGPNVSQYIASLNVVPSAADMASSTAEEDFFQNDLAQFTNIDFVDLDNLGTPFDSHPNPVPYDPVVEQEARRQNASAFRNLAKQNVDFLNDDFQFSGFGDLPNIGSEQASNHVERDQQQQKQQQQQQQQQPSPLYPLQLNTSATSPTTPTTVASGPSPTAGDKRKLDAPSSKASGGASSPIASEEAARLAAEEDKRRRNTAASARFRIKKKQREQELEQRAKKMTERVGELEGRVKELETENRWLKSLIMEKGEREMGSASGDVRELLKKFTSTGKDLSIVANLSGSSPRDEGRSQVEKKDGVGTVKVESSTAKS
ncbi:hypothetical protein BDY21DRAFT_379736 [Lineolata rhizophorae]|uniref:BZIP domain-containing protein n=1 Tax=Lineolata rhizophorae TaxID=578093 RepID=A0A6A6NYI1_9PEZI|nr:hypothetical protein BDY21DRAFT_379736 [Lineolata rhizophorae]